MYGVLGANTVYPTHYDPKILYPIARSQTRQGYGIDFVGVDYWHCFEVSYLDNLGVSKVVMLRLAINANSPYIVESKSLKLYLNSLNFETFASQDEFVAQVQKDLSACLQTQVGVWAFAIDGDGLALSAPLGLCLDNLTPKQHIALCQDIDSGCLRASDHTSQEKQRFYSHLLRSNCPVTGQPDWGTVQIDCEGACLDPEGLLVYLLSFRKHNGFHEACVERIFADMTHKFAPTALVVQAWYTRRGGIDISPVRVSDEALLPPSQRMVRQ